MESEIRLLFSEGVKTFANIHNLKIQWPDLTPADENLDNDPGFISQDIANEDYFLRPQITSVKPMTFGYRGAAQYIFIAQIGIVVRAGMGDLVASDICDELKKVFPYGHKLIGTKHKYNQIDHFSIRASVKNGAFDLNPCISRYQTIS